MDKKGTIISIIGYLTVAVLILLFGFMGFMVFQDVTHEVKNFKAYQSFCEDKPNFCYCSTIFGFPEECQFKTSWSSQNGFSEDTMALCELAKDLKDKEQLFKAGCLE